MCCFSYWGYSRLVASLIFVCRCILEWRLHRFLYDHVYRGLHPAHTLRIYFKIAAVFRSGTYIEDISHCLQEGVSLLRLPSTAAFLVALRGDASSSAPFLWNVSVSLPAEEKWSQWTVTFEIRSKINPTPLCVWVRHWFTLMKSCTIEQLNSISW